MSIIKKMPNDSTLKESSRFSNDKGVTFQYLVESEFPCINFDNIKSRYCKEYLKIQDDKCFLCSADALIKLESDNYIFVEFKSGKPSLSNIRLKQKDSLLILLNILHKNLDFAKCRIKFYLVISESDCQKIKRYKSDRNNEWYQQEIRANSIFSKYKLVNNKKFDEISDSKDW